MSFPSKSDPKSATNQLTHESNELFDEIENKFWIFLLPFGMLRWKTICTLEQFRNTDGISHGKQL